MNFLVWQAEASFYCRDLLVAFLPPRDGDGYSSENKMGRVPWKIGRAGFINVAQLHVCPSIYRHPKKSDWGWGWKPRHETLGDSTQTR